MADLFALSDKVIDQGTLDVIDGPVNRITQELSELGNNLAVVESFSHSVVFRTEDGLVVFDTSGAATGIPVVEAIRAWSKDRFNTVVYTHGHVDHVGGSGAFMADARDSGAPDPRFVGHHRVRDRMRRYRLTNGYNMAINLRQFKGFTRRGYGIGAQQDSDDPNVQKSAMTDAVPTRKGPQMFLPEDAIEPTTTYENNTSMQVGSLEMQLHHAKGETDDHTWTWIPEHKAICAGDFFIWNFPNCGNPQKVQRYPVEWAQAMRDMMAMQPEMLLPAHGLPIRGAGRVHQVLNDVATNLERLSQQSLQMMNDGAVLDDLLHNISVPAEELEKPWLRPMYDEPEFVVRNMWRLYGGWYDGNPARLKPARDDILSAELAALCGGVAKLTARARELADKGDLRLACHLVETAVQAEPNNAEAHKARSEIYQKRRDAELSLMSKGIFGTAANESRDRANALDNNPPD